MQIPASLGLAVLAGLAAAAVVPRTGTTDIQFCTASTYATGACPYAQPTAGSGTCGTLEVEANVCCKTTRAHTQTPMADATWYQTTTDMAVTGGADTFDDFPDAPAALIGDVNYISIPSGGSITGCNLYK